MYRKLIAVALALSLVGIAGFFGYNSDSPKEARLVASLVDRNIAARGGEQSWAAVESMRLEGQMDLGRGMVVPYVLEQKRPGRMCLEFVFDGDRAVQCTDGKSGWKVAPFRGRPAPEPMSEVELRETADSADPYGLLYHYAERGIDVDVVGRELVDGRETVKLQVTLPRGGVRWLYLDAETALEVKLEAHRTIAGRQQLVATHYSSWESTDGLLIARHQETSTDKNPTPHFLTVESVTVNPAIDDARFRMPEGMAVASSAGR